MRWLPWLLCAVLLLAMWHDGCKTGETTTRSDTVVTYDTIERTIQTKPCLFTTYRTDTILDTAYVVHDYSTAKVYRDSLVTDTLALYVQDTIQYNAIQGRSVAYTLRLPTKTITNTITQRRAVTGLYITPYASQDRTIGIGATYVAPRWLGSVGYGTSGVQVGIGLKIGK